MTDSLVVYLNDHLAGSVSAVEMLDALAAHERGTAREALWVGLKGKVTADQTVLRNLLAQVGGAESRVKQAAAWLGEKAGEAMGALTGAAHPGLRLLEAVETLGLGIQGKAGLWRGLAAVAPREPRLAGVDFAALEGRAQAQFAEVERERVALAIAALTRSGAA